MTIAKTIMRFLPFAVLLMLFVALIFDFNAVDFKKYQEDLNQP